MPSVEKVFMDELFYEWSAGQARAGLKPAYHLPISLQLLRNATEKTPVEIIALLNWTIVMR
jgi:hypothetical protein